MKKELLYPFGFIITEGNFQNRYNWNKYSITKNKTLYYSKENIFASASYNNIELISLGYYLDIRNANHDQESILNNLATARSNSYDSFLDNLQYLSGRYLILLKMNNEIFLFNDTAGLFPVCFHKEKRIIGSHDTLINETLGNILDQKYKNPDDIGLTNNTRFEEVEKLIPNMSLNIDTMRLKRYYPLRPFEKKSPNEIKEELLFYLKETVKWLDRSDYKILLSLTGGGDSRLSLAALKPIVHKLELFTYLKDTSRSNSFVKRTFENDKKIVCSIVENLNLNHHFIQISSDEDTDQSIKKIIQHNVFSNHGLNLAVDYYNLYYGKKYMHVRSTALFNIGKYIFPKSTLSIEQWNIETIAKHLKNWSKISNHEENIEHIKNIMSYAQLDNFYNYNPLELLFLSYRLIQWHSGVVGESDIAFNTMLLINSRKMVDLMLSYPIEDRFHNRLFCDLIDRLWPVLNFWDINNDNNLKRKYIAKEKEIRELQSSNYQLMQNFIKVKPSSKVVYNSKDSGILFRFSDQEIQKNQYFKVELDFAKYKNKEITFEVQFFYNNQKGKGRIIVDSNILDNTGDILDLFGKHEIKVLPRTKKHKIFFKVKFLLSSKNASWLNASRIWIGNLKIKD